MSYPDYDSYEEPSVFRVNSAWLWEPPAPGSYDAVEEVLAGNRTSGAKVGGVASPAPLREFADSARVVKQALNSGHGITHVKVTGLEDPGGRQEGAAATPAGLPVVYRTLERVPSRQPECGIISEREMVDAMDRADLTPTERDVLTVRVGLGRYGHRVTQEALGELRGVSQQAISKSEKNAAEKVRAVLEADDFPGFERRICFD